MSDSTNVYVATVVGAPLAEIDAVVLGLMGELARQGMVMVQE